MSSPRWEPIDDKLLHEVWASDQAMYPAPELTYEHLRSLSDACPELSLCLRATQLADGAGATEPVVHGLVIVWPLLADTYWKQLLDCTIKEHDVKPVMFPPACLDNMGKKTPVGLHVFHIERFSAFQKAPSGAGFTRLALQEVRQRVAKLERTKSWNIVGYSALVATPEGSSSFTQLGFHPPDTSAKEDDEHGSFCPKILNLDGNEPFITSQ